MRKPRKGFEDESDVIVLGDTPDSQPVHAAPASPGTRGGVSRGYQGWLDRDYLRHFPDVMAFLESKENDDLERWLREAIVSIWEQKPSVGLVESPLGHVIPYAAREYVRKAPFNGVTVHTFDRFAGQIPLHLVEMKRLWETARANQHDDYIQATAHDVTQAADILNMELNLRPVILVASLDIRESMTDAEYRVARSVMKSCLGAGCPALFFYSDRSSYTELERRGFFDNGDIPLVKVL